MKGRNYKEVVLASPVPPRPVRDVVSPKEGPRADTDNDLIEAIAAGDHKAYSVLIGRYLSKMVTLAQRIVFDREQAHEIAQEAFLRVWTQAPKWNPEGAATFHTWLRRVVVNLSISQRRRRREQVDISVVENFADGQPDGFDRVVAAQRKRAVQEALLRLPKRQRAALALYYFGETSQAEAAASMGLAPKAFDSLLVRARRSLGKHLTAMGIEPKGGLA